MGVCHRSKGPGHRDPREDPQVFRSFQEQQGCCTSLLRYRRVRQDNRVSFPHHQADSEVRSQLDAPFLTPGSVKQVKTFITKLKNEGQVWRRKWRSERPQDEASSQAWRRGWQKKGTRQATGQRHKNQRAKGPRGLDGEKAAALPRRLEEARDKRARSDPPPGMEASSSPDPTLFRKGAQRSWEQAERCPHWGLQRRRLRRVQASWLYLEILLRSNGRR